MVGNAVSPIKKTINKTINKTRTRQLSLMKKAKSEYGGDLLKTRAGRCGGRPLSTRDTMHVVLRSTKAKGEFSFLRPQHNRAMRRILAKFATKYGVSILSIGNAGNHIHLQIKLASRFTYNSFIRAVTGAIAMAVMGRSHRRSIEVSGEQISGGLGSDDLGSSDRKWSEPSSTKFWDRRPFTRIAKSFREYANLKKYVRVNQVEGEGFSRCEARDMVDVETALALQRSLMDLRTMRVNRKIL